MNSSTDWSWRMFLAMKKVLRRLRTFLAMTLPRKLKHRKLSKKHLLLKHPRRSRRSPTWPPRSWRRTRWRSFRKSSKMGLRLKLKLKSHFRISRRSITAELANLSRLTEDSSALAWLARQRILNSARLARKRITNMEQWSSAPNALCCAMWTRKARRKFRLALGSRSVGWNALRWSPWFRNNMVLVYRTSTGFWTSLSHPGRWRRYLLPATMKPVWKVRNRSPRKLDAPRNWLPRRNPSLP